MIRSNKNELVITVFSVDEEDNLRDDEIDIFVEMCEKCGNAVVEEYC